MIHPKYGWNMFEEVNFNNRLFVAYVYPPDCHYNFFPARPVNIKALYMLLP